MPRTPWSERADDVRAVHRAARRRRHRVRAGGRGATAHARRAAESAGPVRLRSRGRYGAARLGARRVRRRGDRGGAPRGGPSPGLSRAAAGGQHGDADGRARRRRALRGHRAPSLLPARLSRRGTPHAGGHRSRVLHLHGDGALAQHAARARRARRADDDRQRPTLRPLLPALPAGSLGAARRAGQRARLRDALGRGRAADHRARGPARARRGDGQSQERGAGGPGRRRRPVAAAARPGARSARLDRRQHAPRRGRGRARRARIGGGRDAGARAGPGAPAPGAGERGAVPHRLSRPHRGAPQRITRRQTQPRRVGYGPRAARAGHHRRRYHRRAGPDVRRGRRGLRRRQSRPARRPQRAGGGASPQARPHGSPHRQLPRGRRTAGRERRRHRRPRRRRARLRAAPPARRPRPGRAARRGRLRVGRRAAGLGPPDARARRALPGAGIVGPLGGRRPVSQIHERVAGAWQRGLGPTAARVLDVAAGGYHGLLDARDWLYARGVLKCRALGVPVVSVGNLTVGGTGKTPAVELAVRTLIELGHRPAVVSRGYGRRGHGIQIVAAAASIRLDADEGGDEPFLLARRLPGVPVVVGGNRYEAGRHAVARFGVSALVLDDGFQHRTLAKDLEIVMARARAPWGSGRLLPGGPLREPLAALARAHLIVVTGARGPDDVGEVAADARRYAPGVPVLAARHVTTECWEAGAMRYLGPEALRGLKLVAFAGLGSPGGLRRTLEDTGAVETGFARFADHHRYTRAEVGALEQRAVAASAVGLVTTEKDWARLRRLPPPGVPLYVLAVRLALLSGDVAWRAAFARAGRAPCP